jgi:hypothetical protein
MGVKGKPDPDHRVAAPRSLSHGDPHGDRRVGADRSTPDPLHTQERPRDPHRADVESPQRPIPGPLKWELTPRCGHRYGSEGLGFQSVGSRDDFSYHFHRSEPTAFRGSIGPAPSRDNRRWRRRQTERWSPPVRGTETSCGPAISASRGPWAKKKITASSVGAKFWYTFTPGSPNGRRPNLRWTIGFRPELRPAPWSGRRS